MTTPILIPLASSGQEFSVQLGSTIYRLRIWWRQSVTPCWMLDLLADDGTPLVRSTPMLPGADLLGQHKHLGVAGVLYVLSDGEITFEGLGTTTKLYFLPSS